MCLPPAAAELLSAQPTCIGLLRSRPKVTGALIAPGRVSVPKSSAGPKRTFLCVVRCQYFIHDAAVGDVWSEGSPLGITLFFPTLRPKVWTAAPRLLGGIVTRMRTRANPSTTVVRALVTSDPVNAMARSWRSTHRRLLSISVRITGAIPDGLPCAWFAWFCCTCCCAG